MPVVIDSLPFFERPTTVQVRGKTIAVMRGIHAGYLRKLASTQLRGERIPRLAGDVWLHRNERGHRDRFTLTKPFRLFTSEGIAVLPESSGHPDPRLPLLGLRALRWNRLQLTIDCDRCRVTIRKPRRFWLFG